jgi:predicted nuclease with TOPRIM domain
MTEKEELISEIKKLKFFKDSDFDNLKIDQLKDVLEHLKNNKDVPATSEQVEAFENEKALLQHELIQKHNEVTDLKNELEDINSSGVTEDQKKSIIERRDFNQKKNKIKKQLVLISNQIIEISKML